MSYLSIMCYLWQLLNFFFKLDHCGYRNLSMEMTDNITLQSLNDAERHTRVMALRHGYIISTKQIQTK